MNNPGNQANWYNINLTNNMIVNNVTQFAGGGISLSDAAKANIINNTIANNDSAATNQDTFVAGLTNTTAQIAGVVSRLHSQGLVDALAAATPLPVVETFSNPVLQNNIIYQNRSFTWESTINGGLGGLLPDPTTPVFSDFGVSSPSALDQLNPTFCLLSAAFGVNNQTGDPLFGTVLNPPYFNVLLSAQAGGEGLNSVKVLFTPLASKGDYHIQAGSSGD